MNWLAACDHRCVRPLSVADCEYLLGGRKPLTTDRTCTRVREHDREVPIEISVGPRATSGFTHAEQCCRCQRARAAHVDWVEAIRKFDGSQPSVASVRPCARTSAWPRFVQAYFFPDHKEALILDDRNNGGGFVADYYIDTLRKQPVIRWATRYGKDLRTPRATIDGPKVMIINEGAGSGGDLLPWMFRKYKMGPLVGQRTWGGLVGVLGFPVLMDGGTITAPNLAIWTPEDGWVVENAGVAPDLEVEQTPAARPSAAPSAAAVGSPP